MYALLNLSISFLIDLCALCNKPLNKFITFYLIQIPCVQKKEIKNHFYVHNKVFQKLKMYLLTIYCTFICKIIIIATTTAVKDLTKHERDISFRRIKYI